MKITAFLISLLVATIALAQPYEPHIIWDRSGETDSSAYGYKILPLGDQNDDGFADWAVLAHGNIATYHGTRRPYLEFFHGDTMPSTEPYFVFQQDSPAYYQSWSAGVIGDINGDGYKDWMTAYWPQGFPAYRIYGFFYGGHGPSSAPDVAWSQSVVTGFYGLPEFDFNGDGTDDLYWGNNETGEVRVYFGSSPLDTLSDWSIAEPPQGINQTLPYAVGDFNGDGASDFLCYNPNNWNVAVFLGATQADTIPDFLWTLPDRVPVDGVKSLNGDDADELIIVSFDGMDVCFGRQELSPTPDYILNFSCEGGPHTAVSAGDFNADGYGDILTYVPSCISNPFGALTLHLGYSWLNAEPVISIEGDTPPLHLRGIYTAAGLGDVNGDGYDEFAIGAWNETFGPWRGRCVIVAGDSLTVSVDDPRPELVQKLDIEVYPNPFNAETTIRLEAPQSQDQVTLSIYNVLGQEVQREILPKFSGQYAYHLSAQDWTTGLYFIHVQSGSVHTTAKLMLLR